MVSAWCPPGMTHDAANEVATGAGTLPGAYCCGVAPGPGVSAGRTPGRSVAEAPDEVADVALPGGVPPVADEVELVVTLKSPLTAGEVAGAECAAPSLFEPQPPATAASRPTATVIPAAPRRSR